ncbi:MAG: glycosyltransferase family 9 protein [Ignavibacteriaceae bacterium]|nr:glycosyltransferase family 9 protein [Ignavibacteriaceae bacterium]
MITPKNLLIVRTDRIGDVVLSLPLAGIIKKHYPECRITFLLREYTLPLALNNPFIDEVIVLKENNGKVLLNDNIHLVSKNKYDSVIVVSPSFIITLLIFLCRIKNRIGTGYRWYSFFFNRKIYEHRKYGEKHELEFNVDLLAPFGINESINYENVKFNFYPGEAGKAVIRKTFEENKIPSNKPVIIIHPGSGGSAVDWPVNKFKQLIKSILDELDVSILLTGSKSEISLCEELRVSEKIKNFAGKFDLAELIALIDTCDIFISNSTGPIHIAAALGKYTIGFYPKIPACSPKRWGPYTKRRVVFTPSIECFGCTRKQCEMLNCMDSIKTEDVMAEIKKEYKTISKYGELNA